MNQRILWNEGWKFAKTDVSVEWENRAQWESGLSPVDLPHDWLIYNTLDLYEDSIGWYQKNFRVDELTQGNYILRFEGVYMNSTVYVNNRKVGEWKYGYSTFDWNITEFLQEGENEVVVKVVHQAPNSRWYSGAGIYRNVWLIWLPEVHIPCDGIYVHSEEEGEYYHVDVATEITGMKPQVCILQEDNNTQLTHDKNVTEDTSDEKPKTGSGIKQIPDSQYELEHILYNQDQAVWQDRTTLPVACDKHTASFYIENPRIWDITEPNLYTLETRLYQKSVGAEAEELVAEQKANQEWQLIQTETQRIGFRKVEYTPEKGFLLNGRKVRLNGACDHHDLGALGAAFNKVAMRRKLEIMRSMGVNAIRTSHNMPAVELMDMADEMGFLVVSEAFDMWEIQKTTYDYGRFFKEWSERDVRSWIRRDRNHPSIIMWSIGNEISDTHADEHGQEITRYLIDYVREWDYRNNAPITIGSNYMPWENAQKCADIVKFAGYNYAEKYYDEHHAKYPDWIIYGSETSSVLQSRGVYHFPLEKGSLIEEDEQCSALGNSTASWAAKNAEYCITMDRDREYSCGQFIWTAFDYIGEPTPYQTKNSYFGQIDTAGFPKDSFYLYQAEWTDYRKNPMVHVYPYWDFNPGQMIDIRVTSNAPCVELFINGESQGKQNIDHVHGTELQPHFKVPYVKGSIKAVAYDEQGNVIAQKERHSFGDSYRIVLSADKTVMKADGEDLIFVEISTRDKDGYPVENASDYVHVKVSGAARLVGLDNGDSADFDQYKGTVRKLFNGKLLAILAAKKEAGDIELLVEDAREQCITETSKKCDILQADNSLSMMNCEYGCTKDGVHYLQPATLQLRAEPALIRDGICATQKNTLRPLAKVPLGFVPVRKMELTTDSNVITAESPSSVVCANIYPQDASDKALIWKLTDMSGAECSIAKLEVLEEGSSRKVTGLGDGEFMVRCMTRNGTDKVKLISQLEMKIQGMGAAYRDPYTAIYGCTYDEKQGDVGRGEENSAGTDKEGNTVLTYHNLDLGDYGSDKITLAIFANDNDPHPIEIWRGIPGAEDAELLGDVIYQKPGIWNVFQPETFTLPRRVKGINTISIVAKDKFFLRDFVFTKIEKAFEQLSVIEVGTIYGDSYHITEQGAENIGNNVSIDCGVLNFGDMGVSKVTIHGRTPLPHNTVQIRFGGDGDSTQVVEFPFSKEYETHTFQIAPVAGTKKVTFVFLPGCNFDFAWFQFS